MENKITINVPDGYEIDKENSTFDNIKLKPSYEKKSHQEQSQKRNIKKIYMERQELQALR